MFKDKQDFIQRFRNAAKATLGKELEECGLQDKYYVLARMIAGVARQIRTDSDRRAVDGNKKKVYYFSMEFLIGRVLENYLINFGIRDIVVDGLRDLGVDFEDLCKEEHDPGLGNGGLGRLAACLVDSLASLGYSGHGNGIRYRYGLF